jgi:RecJ-like exonuclease
MTANDKIRSDDWLQDGERQRVSTMMRDSATFDGIWCADCRNTGRWPVGIVCPSCKGQSKTTTTSSGDRARRRCRDAFDCRPCSFGRSSVPPFG